MKMGIKISNFYDSLINTIKAFNLIIKKNTYLFKVTYENSMVLNDDEAAVSIH